MKIKPQWENVLLEAVDANATKGKIIIPSTVKGPSTSMYRVLEVGEGPMLADGTATKHRINVGDLVLVQKGSRIQIETPDGDRYLCRERDCLGTVEM